MTKEGKAEWLMKVRVRVRIRVRVRVRQGRVADEGRRRLTPTQTTAPSRDPPNPNPKPNPHSNPHSNPDPNSKPAPAPTPTPSGGLRRLYDHRLCRAIRASRAHHGQGDISPLDLPYISPISPLYLAYISPISPLPGGAHRAGRPDVGQEERAAPGAP